MAGSNCLCGTVGGHRLHVRGSSALHMLLLSKLRECQLFHHTKSCRKRGGRANDFIGDGSECYGCVLFTILGQPTQPSANRQHTWWYPYNVNFFRSKYGLLSVMMGELQSMCFIGSDSSLMLPAKHPAVPWLPVPWHGSPRLHLNQSSPPRVSVMFCCLLESRSIAVTFAVDIGAVPDFDVDSFEPLCVRL